MGGGGGGGSASGGGGADAWGGWGGGHGVVRAYISRRRATRQLFDAVEADLKERGLEIPPRPLSPEKIFGAGFACGLFLGLLIGLVFWELT